MVKKRSEINILKSENTVTFKTLRHMLISTIWRMCSGNQLENFACNFLYITDLESEVIEMMMTERIQSRDELSDGCDLKEPVETRFFSGVIHIIGTK